MTDPDKNKVFVDGMKFEKPREGSPEWVKGRISIFAEKIIPFIQTYKNEKGWLNIELKQGREGALYLELNQFVPKKQDDDQN